MKRLIFVMAAVMFFLSAMAEGHPGSIAYGGQASHVQGIAWDEAAGLMYMSFTTRFVVVDKEGNLKGSVDRIHGHLGAMTWDPVGRKVYASLEYKSDEIGAGISRMLGTDTYSKTQFFIAEIAVDGIRAEGTPMDSVMKLHEVSRAEEDFLASVEVEGQCLEHRYGCSGIDGIAIAPGFGSDKRRYLYVAYGIYGDVGRKDNDHQVLLRYPIDRLGRKPETFFARTGNTTYGVQNMAYDEHSGLLILAVYPGRKPEYGNYNLFALDMKVRPRQARLEGVPYQKRKVKVLTLAGEGWHFPYGSMGMCSLGDGYWYFAQPSESRDGAGKKSHSCNARMYRWCPPQLPSE